MHLGKIILLGHLTKIKIQKLDSRNRIIRIMQIQYFGKEVHFAILFPKISSLKTYCAYFFFSGKLKFLRRVDI